MSEPEVSFDEHEHEHEHGLGSGSPVADRVYDLLAPVVATVEVDLVDIEWGGGVLRVVADAPGTDRISTDKLAEVNRLVSPILDQHDPIPGRYTLEVTSPGVERTLRRPDHFRRAVGETVVVKAVPGVEPRRVKGELRSLDDAVLQVEAIEIDGVDLAEPEVHRIDLADVASAKTAFDWGPKPKPGKGPGKNAKKKKSKQPQPKRSEDNR